MLTALTLLISLLASSISLEIEPRFQHNWGTASFLYKVAVPNPQGILCTGWRYPIVNMRADEWPTRRSCRASEYRLVIEQWGGRAYPLPFSGTYEGFAELRDNQFNLITAQTVTFQLLEGSPQ